MNTLLKGLKEEESFTLTQNGAVARNTTFSKVYDLFAFGGAYRNNSAERCLKLFKDAYRENKDLALKCLFYLGDCRGGQGERRFFKICFNWLAVNEPDVAENLMEFVPTYRRWDDLIYTCVDTPLKTELIKILVKQLMKDMTSTNDVSLLGKWMPSENASAAETKRVAGILREGLGLSHKSYRQMLSKLRKKINVLENLMSSNKWESIEFDKIPAKAGLNYSGVFERREETKSRYIDFILNKTSKVNSGTLYPYEIVRKVIRGKTNDDVLEKYWKNLPDYFNGKPSNILCVVDTSGSMTWATKNNIRPIDVAISLGYYAAERAGGPFKNHYISFSTKPSLVEINSENFPKAVREIYNSNICESTNLTAAFFLLLEIINKYDVKPEDMPEYIVVISDMEIDGITNWGVKTCSTEMEKIRKIWNIQSPDIKMPKLIYWNVNATNNIILDSSDDVTYVSGCSPTIFESILTGKTGYDLCMEILNSERYKDISC